MTDEWLNQMEGFSTRGDRLIDEIEAELSRFGGDILDNGPKGSGRYMSDHLKDLVVRWAGGAMAHEREACAKVCEDFGESYDNEWNRNLGVANDLKEACDDCAQAIRARSEA